MPQSLTHLPLRTALLRLALPLAGTMALETAFNFVNGFWVGQLGTVSFAAVNICSFSLWIMISLTGTISIGCNAVIAQAIGGADFRRANSVAWTCLALACLWGGALAAAAYHFADDYLAWQAGKSADVAPVLAAATDYLRRLCLFAPAFCLNEVLSAILRARGDTRTPFLLYSMAIAVNFVLDPVLIFGWGPFPALGLEGAALASGISFSLMVLVFLGVLRNRLEWATPGWRDVPSILRIGLPSSLTSAFFSFVFILITPTVAQFGPSALAALGIGHRIESFSYLISHGLALASITLVGQHIGAGDPARAYAAASEACSLVLRCMLISTLLLALVPGPMVSVFSDDPDVIERAVIYLRWMAMAQWCTGLAVVLEGVMAGAGRPLPVTITSGSCAGARWPAAHWASRHYGLAGIWVALVALRWLEAILCMVVFRRSSVWVVEPPADSL